jgi:hypothetical protein
MGGLVQQPAAHGAHRQHPAGRSRGTLLRHAGTTCHGGVTQTKWPPTNPGRFTGAGNGKLAHVHPQHSTPISAATLTKAGSSTMVSFKPVSQPLSKVRCGERPSRHLDRRPSRRPPIGLRSETATKMKPWRSYCLLRCGCSSSSLFTFSSTAFKKEHPFNVRIP